MLIDGQEWRLVPAEPTPEMMAAAIGAYTLQLDGTAARIIAAHKAMLDAAPSLPAQASRQEAPSDETPSGATVHCRRCGEHADVTFSYGQTTAESAHPIPRWLRESFSRIEDNVHGMTAASVFTEMRTKVQAYFAGQPATSGIEWRNRYTRMRDLCASLSRKLAEYEAQAPAASAEPVAFEIRFGPRLPASIELTPFPGRAEEARNEGWEVRELVYRSASVALQVPDYKLAFDEWIEKTNFVKDWISAGRLSVKYLGWHRADIMRDLIEQNQPTTNGDAPPSKPGVYAWTAGTANALVLVNRRPSAHSPGNVLNGHVIGSTKFYDGCPVDEWGCAGRWVLLHDFDAAPTTQGASQSTKEAP